MNYIPQGAMHRMRAGFADGAPIRNRNMEQYATRSGNPNMPIFNTARQALGARSNMAPPTARGYMPQMGATSTKPAMSFHQGQRPAMAPWQGGAPGRSASMPAQAPVPMIAMNQNMGTTYSDYFGRNLPVRLRG